MMRRDFVECRMFKTMLTRFILPVALGGWFAFGLADTWVDFRRRARAADQTRE